MNVPIRESQWQYTVTTPKNIPGYVSILPCIKATNWRGYDVTV